MTSLLWLTNVACPCGRRERPKQGGACCRSPGSETRHVHSMLWSVLPALSIGRETYRVPILTAHEWIDKESSSMPRQRIEAEHDRTEHRMKKFEGEDVEANLDFPHGDVIDIENLI